MDEGVGWCDFECVSVLCATVGLRASEEVRGEEEDAVETKAEWSANEAEGNEIKAITHWLVKMLGGIERNTLCENHPVSSVANEWCLFSCFAFSLFSLSLSLTLFHSLSLRKMVSEGERERERNCPFLG